jgi:predicted metal-dependent phosphoesterase TrpH
VIPGIELSSEYDGVEVHILGYCFDPANSDLRTKLALLRQNRIARVYEMVDKLKGLGINLNAESVFEIGGDGTVGRLHIARAMVKDGFVGSTSEAFQRYIGDKSPAYVCGFRFSPLEAIKLIRGIGGVAVLAHPYLLRNDEMIRNFVDFGIMGLEVYYPEHTQSMINRYLELAKEYNLLVTGGSDCHGKAKPDIKIGLVKLPYQFVEKLKSAASG